jgi:hypothetical protein
MNKRTCNDALQRADVIEAVVSRVGAGWTVDLDEPQVVVLVEVATRMAGVGILQRWQELHKFNVRALAESGGVEEVKDGSSAAASSPAQEAAKQAKAVRAAKKALTPAAKVEEESPIGDASNASNAASEET